MHCFDSIRLRETGGIGQILKFQNSRPNYQFWLELKKKLYLHFIHVYVYLIPN